MPFSVEDVKDLIRLLQTHPEWLEEVRKLVLTRELLTLPELFRELVEEQKEFRKDLRQLTQRVDQLAADLQTLTQRVDQLTQRVDDLTGQVKELSQSVQALLTWQKGEAGRREGERYEQRMIKRATVLFMGGIGGTTDHPTVQPRLSRWLRAIFEKGYEPEDDEDPTLADLIWWKDDQVAVVEISRKVNGKDVLRAYKLARLLRRAGVNAFPVVVGEDWATLDAREVAKEHHVEWLVGGVPSQGLIKFRKLRYP